VKGASLGAPVQCSCGFIAVLSATIVLCAPSPGSRMPKSKDAGKGKTSTELALVGPNGPSNSLVPAGAAPPSLTPAK